MASRGYGTGTFTRRGKSWRGQFIIDGERVSITRRTKQEVLDAAAELRAKSAQGIYAKRNDITVRELYEIYYEKMVLKKVAEQTAVRYRSSFKNHILPFLGDVPIQEVTREMIEDTFCKQFKDSNFCQSTVAIYFANLKRMFKWAVNRNLLARNPCNGVELPVLREPKKISAYTLEEQKTILEFCQKEWYDWIFYFLALTGTRFGEAAALSWDDIDFNNNTINIYKTVVNIHGAGVIQQHTKTEAGSRTIIVSSTVIDFLRSIKKKQNQELNTMNLVFPSSNYGIYLLSSAHRRWQRDCEEMVIQYKGVHALRHTWATRALEAGVDVKTVSKMLGHRNVVTTMNIYQDVLPDHQRSAVEKIDEFLR